MNGIARTLLLIILPCTLFVACSTTRNLPQEETLYTGIKEIQYVNDSALLHSEIARNEVEAALSYPPNNAIFGSSTYQFPFPFGLWVYNAFVHKQQGLGKWIFNHFSSEPVYVSTVNPDIRARVATNLLHDYGFFRGKVTSEIVLQKNPRKEKVSYMVNAGHLFTIDSIRYRYFPRVADTLISHSTRESFIKADTPFSVELLEKERNRLTTLLRNNGYYYYRNSYITFKADTLQTPGKVWLQIQPIEGIPTQANRPWYIGDITINLYKDNIHPSLDDTLQARRVRINYSGEKVPLRPRVLFHNLRLRHGAPYSEENQRMSQENMARMGVFSSVDMQFIPRDNSAMCDTLDVLLNAHFDKLWDVAMEVNATSKSNDQVGPGLSLGLSKKNVFRGGETFSVKLDASYEWQTGNTATGKMADINSWELGMSTTLTYPRLMFPGLNTRRSRFFSQTEFKLYANQLNRAGYFRLLSFGGNAIYSFQTSPTSKHSFTPFRLSFNMVQDIVMNTKISAKTTSATKISFIE